MNAVFNVKDGAGLAGLKGIIEERVRSIEEQLELVLTTLNLRPEAGGEILRMTGFVPSGDSDRLAAFLDSRDVVYLLEEPDKDDRIPVKLKNGRVVRLFEPITRIFGLPSYAELDTTPFFAPFFAFFFGMCLADFGYGLIVLALSAAAFFVLKKPVMKSIAALGMILGFTTLIGGVILDTLFGTRISDISDLPESISRLILFRDNDSAMYFAISLGVIQVMFGFVLQTVNRIRQDGFQGGLKPIGTFLLIVGVVFYAMGALGTDFAIGPIPVGKLFHAGGIDPGRIGMVLLIGGVALVLFFNSLDKKIWLRPLLGLWEMYGIVSGVPGDILSYIRLFALGLAGGLLGGAINQIAFMVRGDTPGIISTVLMLLVLAGGHGINFALAALGAFVHPLRLTFVEFYKAVGFSGGGKAYTPFARKSITEGGNA